MARGKSCIWAPEVTVDGKKVPSRLARDLQKKWKLDRSTALMLYAQYLKSDAKEKMNQAGYKENTQGEHNAEDLLQFLDFFGTWKREVTDLHQTARVLGFEDDYGQPIDFTDAKEALEKADDLNTNSNSLVAYVVQHGNIYNVYLQEKKPKNINMALDARVRLQLWDVTKDAFNSVGIDLTNVPDGLKDSITPYNRKLVENLFRLQNASADSANLKHLTEKDLLTLFALCSNPDAPRRLVANFGSLEDAAHLLYEALHGTATITEPQRRLLANAITNGRQVGGLDLEALNDHLADMRKEVFERDPKKEMREYVHEWEKKAGIGVEEVHLLNKDIRTLSQAAAQAVMSLQRKIREIERVQGNTEEAKQLNKVLEQLSREMAAKRYHAGLLNFLETASEYVDSIHDKLVEIQNTGTDMEQLLSASRTLASVNSIKDQFFDLTVALANENLQMDESMSPDDVQALREKAQQLKSVFEREEVVIKTATEKLLTDLLTQIIGNNLPDGQSIVNAVKMATTDSSWIDYLYSVARASNPIIAAMGTLISNAQVNRSEFLNDIALRTRRANERLFKSGHKSTEFMYEKDGHIISDIDWASYDKARRKHYGELRKAGKTGFTLRVAMKEWEEENTVERVVDTKNGRTERVPNENYRKEFPHLNEAQQEYYDTMMQIKGEIGSLLPVFAQNHYLPPQVRRDSIEALSKAKSMKDVGKVIKLKVEDLYTVREDDENFASKGIIVEGEEYENTESDYANSELQQIPIFYINKLKDQAELTKDFSGAMMHLAGTAINYDAINEISDAVQLIGDFVGRQRPSKDPKQADVVENQFIRIIQDVFGASANTTNAALVDGFIQTHLFGKRMVEGKNINSQFVQKLGNALIGYTSFKGLATNIKGAFSNYIVGEAQMLIEAGAGEFYGFKDYFWAHSKLMGNAGMAGELMELATNNVNHKSVLFREMFDPMQENFSDKSHTRFRTNFIQHLISTDCSFIGYTSGEYLIHYVNMYSILHHEKVKLNGKKISLYDAFEVTNKEDGNSELKLKDGVTLLDGSEVTKEYLDTIKRKVKYCNQSTHGAMNAEDKGLLHRTLVGRALANFRQWMIEHYSRRFRGIHWDGTIGQMREGYWVSLYKGLMNEDTKDMWRDGQHMQAISTIIKDLMTFMFRSQASWNNLTEMQKYNVKRARTEIGMWIALMGLSMALGEPDEHKKDFWRRWWIYQVKRLKLDTEASMPIPQALSSMLTILQSPMASVNTLNSLLYTFYGLQNGDLHTELKSGPYKGWNKYLRNMLKYNLPIWKDVEQMRKMDTDDSIFKIFEQSPSNY